jgi:hypothetical protein
MWVKLANEFLNLDHVFRVRINKSWGKDGDCLVAEVETPGADAAKQVIRYRGPDAEALHALLQGRAALLRTLPTGPGRGSPVGGTAGPAPIGSATHSPSTATLSDLSYPSS